MPGAEQPLRDLLVRLPVAAAVCDDSGRIVSLNDRFAALVGYTPADIPSLAEWWSRACPDADRRSAARERWDAALARATRGATRVEGAESRITCKDGSERVVAITPCVSGGEVLMVLEDVTARRQAERDLASYREWVDALVRAIPNPLFAKDRGGRYTLVNRAWEEFVDRSSADIVGKTVEECWNTSDAATYHRKDLELMATDGVQNYEHRLRNAAGAMRDIIFQKTCYHAADGSVAGLVGTFLDVTELKRAETEVRQAEARTLHAQKLESLGVLAGGIAHDFNNLLVAILGHADLALADLDPSSPGVRHIREVRTAAVRASELSNQILAYSGRGRFVVKSLDLNAVVTELGHLLGAAVSKKTDLRFRLAPDLPPVDVDAVQIQQLIMNLVTNASEALEERPGAVTIATEAAFVDQDYLASSHLGAGLPGGRYVGLEVSDTGHGMDERTRSRLFDPFFSTKGKGRGLGLAAIQGIVRGHRGAIRVHSEPGRGTCIKVLLPASGRPLDAIPGAPPDAIVEWRTEGTVLVVDDEPSVREIARLMLERCGFSILTAADGEEAVAIYRTHADEISAVLLDVTMPRMSGEQALEQLVRIRPDVRVVLTSGYDEQDVTARFTARKMAGFVRKPFDLRTLLSVFRRALECDPPGDPRS